jgi:hypothetical protein
MNQVRGILYIGVGAFIAFRGWRIHHGVWSWASYGLGAAAIALGCYLLSRRGRR